MVSLLNSLFSSHARRNHTVVDETSSASSAEEQLHTKSAKSSGVDDADVYIPTLEKVPADVELNPAELSFEKDAYLDHVDVAGGMGRHLGMFSCTMLITGTIIGTGIFSTPSSVLGSIGSVGASLMLLLLGFILAFCSLFVWLEFGTMFPRSGGEKVYLEVVYRKPKYLATVIFAANAVVLGFASSSCVPSIDAAGIDEVELMKANPALRLLQLYRGCRASPEREPFGMVYLSTTTSVAISHALANVPILNTGRVKRWLDGW
ncbi:hypothetical protein BD413DRAFT_496283 [Trametes elegans]|nr:hypothetical protein BD413DRAFT_496283 [Trametes elegans]